MTVEDLIYELNLHFPSNEQIIARYSKVKKEFDEKKANEYRDRTEMKLNETIEPYSNEIEHLVYNTNITSAGIGSISFFLKFDIFEDSLPGFASHNDYYTFCYNPENGSIISFNDTFEKRENVAISIDQFFDFLCVYERYHRHFIFGGDFPERKFKSELINLIKNGFSKSWIDILIVKELNKPEKYLY